jgi:hypothetical protein
MSVRVGRISYTKGHRGSLPAFEGYSPVVCLTADSPYGSLSPYELRDEKGRCIENLWQFAKIYPNVPAVRRVRSRIDSRVIWDYSAEQHIDEEAKQVLPSYWEWRKRGMEVPFPIRYPVGYIKDARASCRGALWNGQLDPTEPFPVQFPTSLLDYVSARKAIYVPLYEEYVKIQPQWKGLAERLASGENLLILEVDGPHEESLPYYIDKYSVAQDFITGDTVVASDKNLDIFLNDELHPYGHGYCLARTLLHSGSM